MAEVTSNNEKVCIDTDEDILCQTPPCCNEAGLDFDNQTMACKNDGQTTGTQATGEGMACMATTSARMPIRDVMSMRPMWVSVRSNAYRMMTAIRWTSHFATATIDAPHSPMERAR